MSLLPEGFADLEGFVADWAIEGTAARALARDRAAPEDMARFYAAASLRVGAALDYLDGVGLERFDAADSRLMALMLSLAHVTLAAEVQGVDEVRHRLVRPKMVITRSAAGV